MCICVYACCMRVCVLYACIRVVCAYVRMCVLCIVYCVLCIVYISVIWVGRPEEFCVRDANWSHLTFDFSFRVTAYLLRY